MTRTDPPLEVTTVGVDHATVHRGADVHVFDDLEPGSEQAARVGDDKITFQTLPHPGGELLCRFATTNDVHFGETVCGHIDGVDTGPELRTEPGQRPYPEVMNEAACQEIAAIEPAAVVVKGDLTTEGTIEEYEAFLRCYQPAFGDRLHHVRGNHDSYHGGEFAAWPAQRVDLPGVTLAIIDTSIPHAATGRVTEEQVAFLDDVGTTADRPVLVLGHHHPWQPGSDERPDGYFGIHPDDSEALVDVFARRPRLRGYFAGHTHRNRRRTFTATGDVPYVEVASVKDFPGAWAEYQVYEGGIVQLMHRVSAPEALAWTERTRSMFFGTYPAYSFGELSDRCFVIAT